MEYDAANRLVLEEYRDNTSGTPNDQGGDRDVEHVYDDADNRILKEIHYLTSGNTIPDVWEFTYNILNQLEVMQVTLQAHFGDPAQSRIVEYDYDANGNRVGKDDTVFEFDYENRMVRDTYTSGDTTEYHYDYRTRRIAVFTTTGVSPASERYFSFYGGTYIEKSDKFLQLSVPDFSIDDPNNPGVDPGVVWSAGPEGAPIPLSLPHDFYGHSVIDTNDVTKTWLYSDAAKTQQIGYFENPPANPRIYLSPETMQSGDPAVLGGATLTFDVQTLFSPVVIVDYHMVVHREIAETIRGTDMGGGVGGILHSIREGEPAYFHYNGRGDVVAQTDDASEITYEAAYEAFGTRPYQVGTTQDTQKANTKDEDPSGLLNEGFRYRDLETGTFITRDPAGFIDGPNLYTYVRQNPWSKFDPEGLASDDPEGVKRIDHHRVPVEAMKENKFSKDVITELEKLKVPAGLSRAGEGFPRHVFNSAHDVYNERAGDITRQFSELAKNNEVDPSGLSGKQAKEFAAKLVNQIEGDSYLNRFNSMVAAKADGAALNKMLKDFPAEALSNRPIMSVLGHEMKALAGGSKLLSFARKTPVLKYLFMGSVVSGGYGAAKARGKSTAESIAEGVFEGFNPAPVGIEDIRNGSEATERGLNMATDAVRSNRLGGYGDPF